MAGSPRSASASRAALGICDGSGWILGPEDVARPCDCRSRMVAQARLRGIDSVIPREVPRRLLRPAARDADATPSSSNGFATSANDLEDNLDSGRGMWFFGGSGTGKTTLAMLISRTALESGRSVAIYSLPKLLSRIRQTYDAEVGEQSYSQFFERLASVDLLHLDDLGVEKQTEWVLEQLYALINERYERQRSLIVTSNLEDDELEKQIGTPRRLPPGRDLRRPGPALRRGPAHASVSGGRRLDLASARRRLDGRRGGSVPLDH